MKYQAVWNDSSGEVVITENETVIHEDNNVGDAPTAGAWVKENGFGFTGMWTKVPNSCEWTADLKAVES